ncbi:MAG: hypothetical protein QOJ67_3000 [Acidimicrobiaceae bacterium]
MGLVCVLVAELFACSSSKSSQSAKVLDCQGATPAVQPSELILACGDGSIRATELHWTAWSASGAQGSGTLVITNCSPNCAIGSRQQFPADFELMSPKAVVGTTFLTELQIRFRGVGPPRTTAVRCRLSDPSFEGGCADQFASAS